MKKIFVVLVATFLTLLSFQDIYASDVVNIDGKFSDWNNKYILGKKRIQYSFTGQGKYEYIYVSSSGELPRKYKIYFGKNSYTVELINLSKLHKKGVHKVSYELTSGHSSKKKFKNYAYVRISRRLKKLELKVPNNSESNGQSITKKMVILDGKNLKVISGGVSTYPFCLVATGFIFTSVYVIFRKRRYLNE